MRGFVTRCGEEKRYIPNESENEKIGIEIRQGSWPFRLLSPSRLEVVAQLCKPCLLCDVICLLERLFLRSTSEMRAIGVVVSHGNQKNKKKKHSKLRKP